jgi:hypothetical protein
MMYEYYQVREPVNPTGQQQEAISLSTNCNYFLIEFHAIITTPVPATVPVLFVDNVAVTFNKLDVEAGAYEIGILNYKYECPVCRPDVIYTKEIALRAGGAPNLLNLSVRTGDRISSISMTRGYFKKIKT